MDPENPISNDDEEFFRNLPVGFRFTPTDEDLIIHYLQKKINRKPLPRNRIKEVQLYNHHPMKLIEFYGQNGKDDVWYFFSPRDKKYPKGDRPNRATKDGNGYWKATGKDKEIFGDGTRVLIGLKKTLVYYQGKPKNSTKTNWIMHEYKVTNSTQKCDVSTNKMLLDPCVLCKIYKNNKKPGQPIINDANDDGGDDDDDEGDPDIAALIASHDVEANQNIFANGIFNVNGDL